MGDDMTTTRFEKIRLELGADGLARIVIDAGKGNVLDLAALRELREAIAELRSGDPPRAILLDHEGEHFSFGASVEDHLPERVRGMLEELHALAREWLALDVPVLAAVRGMCLGGGLELVLLADRVFASPEARLGQPEIRLAVFAPIGSALLPRRIGPQAAADLLLSGRTVEAEEAQRIGLVGEVAADPAAAARAWAAEHLAGKSRAALRFATRAARQPWLGGFLADLEVLERLYLEELMQTHDAVEGLRAFLEKRKPAYEDR